MYGNLTQDFKMSEIAMIKEIEKLIPEYNIYLNYGTLLGAIREKALIDHDNDIDICYLSKFHTAIKVEEEMKGIYRRLINKNLLSNYFTTKRQGVYWEEIKGKKLQDDIVNPFGQAHIRLKNRDVDFFTSWIDENGNYYVCQFGCLGKKEDLLPFKIGRIYDVNFKIPNDSNKILTELYGNWKIPKKEKSKRIRKSYLKEWLNEV